MIDYKQEIINSIESCSDHLRALRVVRDLGLPDSFIAAGFVRNIIWDKLYSSQTAMTDIDVVYFCKADSSESRDRYLEQDLIELEPSLQWSVKNQARMHVRNGDAPYLNTLDAMRYWPEQQTSIGAALDSQGKIYLAHCFDLSLQFNGKINRNPNRDIETFNRRIKNKQWQTIWPVLEVVI